MSCQGALDMVGKIELQSIGIGGLFSLAYYNQLQLYSRVSVAIIGTAFEHTL